MNVGLVDVDSIIANLALMRRSAWHKAQGHNVELAFPLAAHTYDLIERFKVFDFTDDDLTPWSCEVRSGGTGYDLAATFGPEHDTVYPDYAIVGCTHSLGRLTRGCVRRCPWCVVWKQDGRVRQVAELEDFWRGQDHIRLLDDNLTAMPELFVETCHTLAAANVAVTFEALDIRLMSTDMAVALSKVRRFGKTIGRVRFAWDSMADEAGVCSGIEALRAGGFPLYAATFYVLIGFDTTPAEDLYRVETLHSLGVESFAMPFDKTDPYQRRFARWCNHKGIFKTVRWEDYNA